MASTSRTPSDLKILATGLTVESDVDQYFRDLYGSPSEIKAKIDADIENIRAAGFNVDLKYMSDASPEATQDSLDLLRSTIREQKFDGIMVGTGLRLIPQQTKLWEDVMNVIREESPQSVFMYNDGPGGNFRALQRNKERLGITVDY